MSNKVTYTGLAIKPPITLQMWVPKDKITGAKAKLGTTVGGKTVDAVKWSLTLSVCKEGEPGCTTPTDALVLTLISDRTNSLWKVQVMFKDYYVTPPAVFIKDVFKFGLEQDVYINASFNGSLVTITVNGSTVIATDTLKKFEEISTLKAESMFMDSTGAEIPGVGDEYLVFNLTTVAMFDASQILGIVLPLAVLGAVVGLLVKALPRALAR